MKAIIIGGGPAGLTAAYELLCKTSVKPIIIESDDVVGGLSKTINYKGNKLDIGGHRFFSKSKKVMDWWFKFLPLGGVESSEANEFLKRDRKSHILYNKKLYDYPVSLSYTTFKKLGVKKVAKILTSYTHVRLRPIKDERTLEDFFINSFGKELYLTFFKGYTEKVWGFPCREISSDWGRQRIKGVSISSIIEKKFQKVLNQLHLSKKQEDIRSLIEYFYYPKYGPGQLWTEVGKQVVKRGGQILTDSTVTRIINDEKSVYGVEYTNEKGETKKIDADHVFSTMPVKDLMNSMDVVPVKVKKVSDKLIYRDFMTVGLLLSRLGKKKVKKIKDNWIYIHELDVNVGRLQFYHNWSPFLVDDPDHKWVGAEYFVNEGDDIWNKDDETMIEMVKSELSKLGIIKRSFVLDGVVIRRKKAYPSYIGESYQRFHVIRKFVDKYPNLFLIGRYGMHRWNNMDHSMLTAMEAVDCVVKGKKDKSRIWNINDEQEYHEVSANKKTKS